jgi:hypothetical protein
MAASKNFWSGFPGGQPVIPQSLSERKVSCKIVLGIALAPMDSCDFTSYSDHPTIPVTGAVQPELHAAEPALLVQKIKTIGQANPCRTK